MAILDLSYPAILNLFGNYGAEGLNETQAFLKWFLENFYRLDATEVEDSICDQPGDKGIDGIYVNELFQQINVFQTWLRSASTDKDLGDRDLKEFLGTLTQLQTEDGVRKLAAATKSVNLRKLLSRLEIDKKVGEGYDVRGIFVTNRLANKDARDLIAISPNLVVFDKSELERQYLPIDKPEPMAGPITLMCRK